ncbi:hypothetical protein GWK48_01050 [Metallosphaera tengchongensis]|uniref:Uncharacterized protein n=1 Tax=Metallosphaera tengchongensis TaxID=1532350 RepID=A0A6N0NST6_9CREN|nr:hypothetical protein [Metallosphaera tengchongensis]QKQ99166.1 hypothetical protein GWK48_01050 [Metallosphaera tengchongensis]
MLKYSEYVRHGITEPLLLIYVYKKVEDGKVISAFRINVYKNMAVAVYEDDKLQGGEVIDIFPGSLEHILRIIEKYYQKDVDDLVVFGEKSYVDPLLDRLDDIS